MDSDTSFAQLTVLPPLAAESATCVLHTYHWPKPLRVELHHVIPRAWQRTWTPFTGSLGRIWAPTTEAICPSGHRNVHIRMVELMRLVESLQTEDLERVWDAHSGRATKAIKMAFKALEEWQIAGGSLQHLIENNQYGWG